MSVDAANIGVHPQHQSVYKRTQSEIDYKFILIFTEKTLEYFE